MKDGEDGLRILWLPSLSSSPFLSQATIGEEDSGSTPGIKCGVLGDTEVGQPPNEARVCLPWELPAGAQTHGTGSG